MHASTSRRASHSASHSASHRATRTHSPTRPKRRTRQDELTDESFEEYLDGYEEIEPLDLFKVSLGGRVRYTTDEVDKRGRVLKRHFRLGGILIKVDMDLRYIVLKNARIDPRKPSKRGEMSKRTWSVQLKTPGTRVRLFYQAPASGAEVTAFRNLLADLDAGRVELKVKDEPDKPRKRQS